MLFYTFLHCVMCAVCWAADPSTKVVLPQGVLTGIRVQTERRVVVTAYLGIPYALPPLGQYRFAPPERHPGWNDSLSAEHFRPDCMQPNADATAQTSSEDCLYLNVFVPETGTRAGIPVVVFVKGQDYVSGSPRTVSGQELAAEGVIVVTVSYRLNIFGFLCFGDPGGRGNLGLLDQYLALLWVHENILHFGGLADVTLMGHGAGAASVAAHLASPRTRGIFNKAILMSGSAFSPMQRSTTVVQSSRAIARSLGCLVEQPPLPESSAPLTCLRQMSAEQILLAFENAYKNANWTSLLVPVEDSFLPERMRYLPEDPTSAIKAGRFYQVPILTGTTTNEGIVLLEKWSDLTVQTDASILRLIERSAIPYLLAARQLSGEQAAEIVRWRYLESLPGPRLSQLLQLYSEATYIAPHWEQLEYLARGKEPVFVYKLSLADASDLSNNGLGTQLPLLFGPLRKSRQQWQQGSQVGLGIKRLSLRIKRLWTTFMRTGDPNPSSLNASKIWPAYRSDTGQYLELLNDPQTGRTMEQRAESPDKASATFWNILLPRVVNVTRQLEGIGESLDVYNPRPGECTPYKNAMFTTLFFLVLLIVCLVLALVLLKRRTKGRQKTML